MHGMTIDDKRRLAIVESDRLNMEIKRAARSLAGLRERLAVERGAARDAGARLVVVFMPQGAVDALYTS